MMYSYGDLTLVSIPPNCDLRPAPEIWSAHVYDKLIPLRTGMTVIDVGASIGFFTLYASQKIGNSGTVIAFEPEPISYRALEENTAQFSNVVPVNVGLWSECDCKHICATCILTGSSFFGCVNGAEAKIVRLDRILPKLGITHVDFVKIDAEGAANEILKGAINYLPNIDNFAIAAYHPEENPKEIELLLRDSGFRVKTLHRFGFIPFIYATRDPNISLQYVETWQVGVVAGVAGLLAYLAWRKLR